MKRPIKNTLRAMSKHLGIKVQFVDYLADEVHGKLLPREKRILINAHKPRCEHVFTLLHEIGHFLLHFKRLPRMRHPRFFDINWKIEWLASFCSKVRRSFRYTFNKETGKEWEADLWAMCAFLYLAKRIGCRGDLWAFLGRHPEKSNIFLLAGFALVYSDTKAKIKSVARSLVMPFQVLWKS